MNAATPYPGFFISFEGGDYTGKSTQVKLLMQTLVARGAAAISTLEPGGTSLGQRLRREVMHGEDLDPYTEALLSAVPSPDPGHQKERIILEGDIPSTINLPKGCPFAARCKKCKPECLERRPETKEIEPGHFVACHLF